MRVVPASRRSNMKKYCDHEPCPKWNGEECELGFNVKFRVPRSYSDIQAYPPNWGYVMPKVCSKKKPNNPIS